MSTATTNHANANVATSANTRALWIGFLAGPLVWFARLSVGYALVPIACDAQSSLSLHIVSLLAVILILGGIALSWRNWRKSGAATASTIDGGRGPGSFLALGGLALGGIFLLVTLLEWSSVFVLNPCVTGL